jgi:hypothetical protein
MVLSISSLDKIEPDRYSLQGKSVESSAFRKGSEWAKEYHDQRESVTIVNEEVCECWNQNALVVSCRNVNGQQYLLEGGTSPDGYALEE